MFSNSISYSLTSKESLPPASLASDLRNPEFMLCLRGGRFPSTLLSHLSIPPSVLVKSGCGQETSSQQLTLCLSPWKLGQHHSSHGSEMCVFPFNRYVCKCVCQPLVCEDQKLCGEPPRGMNRCEYGLNGRELTCGRLEQGRRYSTKSECLAVIMLTKMQIRPTKQLKKNIPFELSVKE